MKPTYRDRFGRREPKQIDLATDAYNFHEAGYSQLETEQRLIVRYGRTVDEDTIRSTVEGEFNPPQ